MNDALSWNFDSANSQLSKTISGFPGNFRVISEDSSEISDLAATHSEEYNKVARSVRFSALPSQAQLIIKLPVLDFIKELCHELKSASDQALRPRPQMGFSPSYNTSIDLSELLLALEKGEKKLGLVADATPGFNPLTNVSRSVALTCSGIVRSLRKELICGKKDPAHPDQEDLSSLVTILDAACFRLQAERIQLEDIVLNIALQQQLPREFEDVA